MFHVCSCSIPKDEIDSEPHMYCENCYDSYEEHIHAMNEEEIDDTSTWYVSDSEVNYNFDTSDMDTVKGRVRELEDIVGNYMDSYKILDDGHEIQYEYTVPKGVREEELPLLAKVCLGKQIAYCLETHETCSFTAEL